MKTRMNAGRNGIGPEYAVESVDVNVAEDNLVCVVCGRPLLFNGCWASISHPKKKGIIMFACEAHAIEAANWLGQAIGISTRVPEGSKLPNPEEN